MKFTILGIAAVALGATYATRAGVSADPCAARLATFDTLDFTVFSGQKWGRLGESHAQDIIVTWPDGHETNGIAKHIDDLKGMFVYAPNTNIADALGRLPSVTLERDEGEGKYVQIRGAQTAWSNVTVPSPNPSYPAGANLNAITAISASDIWAVGSFYNTSFTISAFALHYNGTVWSVTILPQPAVTGPSSPILHGVTAVASNNVWAVGENEEVPGLGITTLIEHWNGSAWSIVPSPTPGAYPTLNAVAARSASDVYAVGFNEPSVNGGVQQGLILRWNGSTWSADTDPTAGTFSPLYGAATLPGATSEWAAGINAADQALVLSHG